MKITKFTISITAILNIVFLTAALLASSSFGEQIEASKASTSQVASLTDQLKSIEDDVNPAAWNIRNGCVTLRRIKRIKFLDDQTALLSMRSRNPDKRQIILKLRHECPGIRRNGYIHQTSGMRLCAGFDRFTVMGSSGYSCRVESIEPYINIEEPKLEAGLD